MERCEWNTRIISLRNTLLCWCALVIVAHNKGVNGQDCLFRADLCDWSNHGDVDWVQSSEFATTGTAHCAQVPISDTTPSEHHQAVLTSLTQTHEMTMLGFYYRLGAPNTLTVEAELDGALPVQIWSRNGTDGNGWIEVDVPVPHSSSFKISFKAGIPENSTAFIGVTNLTLRIGEDDCASMPCQNGGVCIDGNNSFTCVCSSGFKGEFCQIDTRPRPQTTILPTTEMATNAGMSTPQTQTTTTVKIPQPSQKTTTIKVQPSTYSTVKYGTVSTPGKLPQTGEQGGKMEEPTMIAVIAVSSVVFIAVLGALVWLLVYFKKRSWRPRYHERGVSMENVSTAESIHGKWTSTVDIPGSIPGSKSELPPVEEIALPKKTENIYVTSPTVGLVNTGYNIDNMY